MRQRWLHISLFAVLAGGCASQESADVFVDLTTDLRAGDEFLEVRCRLFVGGEEEHERQTLTAVSAGRDLSTGFRAAEFAEVPVGRVRVELALLAAEEEVVEVRAATLELQRDAGVQLIVARSCVGVVCPDGGSPDTHTDCLGGRCVTPDCAAGVADACETTAISLASLLDTAVSVSCEAYDGCFGATAAKELRGGGCAERLQREVDDKTGPALESALFNGRVEYVQEHAGACLGALGGGCRDLRLSREHVECTLAIVGLVPEGEQCVSDWECAGVGTYCAPDRCPGTCARRIAVGQACGGASACAPGLECVSGLCSVPTAPGDACEPGVARCTAGQTCAQEDGVGSCRAQAENFIGEPGASCDLSLGLGCVMGAYCSFADGVCRGVAAASEPCSPGFPDPCPDDQWCALPGQCTPLPDAGDPCAVVAGRPTCARGNECDDMTSVCLPFAGAGEPCDAAVQCLVACSGGTCADRCSH